MIKIKGIYPPVIVKLGNKTFVISGSTWILVPTYTSMDNVEWINNSVSKSIELFEIMIDSHSGNGQYKVTCKKNIWLCLCIGFYYRKNCSHIKEAKIIKQRK